MFTSTVFASILPEILILVLGIILLIVEPFWKTEQRRNVGWLTAGGLFVAMIVSLLFGQPGEPTAVLGGMIRFDWLGFFFKMLFMFAGAATFPPIWSCFTSPLKPHPFRSIFSLASS